MNQTENNVKIEGILSEVNVNEGEFKDKSTGQMKPYLSGEVKVKVRQEINKVDTESEIPVRFFATKFTKTGAPNPVYASVDKLRKEFVSIASSENGEAGADCIRVNGASIEENIFVSKSGRLISSPDIRGSFFDRVSKNECKPEATFKAVVCIGSIKEEIVNDEPTGCLVIQGVLSQYGGRADVVDFRVCSKDAIDHIQANWNQGDTVKVAGKVNFTTKTVYDEENVGFGEPIVTSRTTTVRELIITSGSPCALEGEFALDANEVADALNARQQRIAAKKSAGSAPAPTASKSAFSGLGF